MSINRLCAVILTFSLAFPLAFSTSACSGDDPPTDAGDTGPGDTGASDSGDPDTATPDTGPGDTGTMDSGPSDTGPGDTGAGDAMADATADAMTDATADATDATDAAAPTPDTIFGIIGGQLVEIDGTTAAMTDIGPTGIGADQIAEVEWDPVAGVARTITSTFTAPSLGTIDLCTGAIRVGARVTEGGTNLSLVEGLASDLSTGTFYAAIDADRGGAFLSETLAILDISTATATVIGTYDTRQDDIDQMLWDGSRLIGLDVESGTGATIYELSTTTGEATSLFDVSDQLQRIARDVAGDRWLGVTREANRALVVIDSTTGSTTTIGITHTSADRGGAVMAAFFVAPVPTCP